MKTSIVCVAVFMLFMALHPAHAQRCPAGADAFQNCLPLDHRYGGPGEIPRPQLHRAQRTQQILTPHNRCKREYVMKLDARTHPALRRQLAEMEKLGGGEKAAKALKGTRDFRAINAEAERACR
jgi:hypothetical protein